MVDRDTGFIDCFAHVLGSQSRSRSHEYDLLAILVGNATNQGIYGMAQISIVPMISSALSGRTIFARNIECC
ncbi:Tn3 family transposase [Enterobacter hormaechei]|uniref:Tn3 family transposase n=1 Tax=Enterobacter hormaechei TaxID=158836 RepID=UPI00388D6BD7